METVVVIIIMNFHLHSHMCEYIKDYGIVYSFWLFPLKKLNGLLGSYPTNARNISIQIMQGFLDYTTFAPCKWPDKYKNDFLPVLEKHKYNKGTDIEIFNLITMEECAFTTSTITTLQHNCNIFIVPRRQLHCSNVEF